MSTSPTSIFKKTETLLNLVILSQNLTLYDAQGIDANAINTSYDDLPDDMDQKVKLFTHGILTLFDKCAPLKTILVQNLHKKYIPTIQLMIKIKIFLRKYTTCKNLQNRQKYIQIKNFVNVATKREKADYTRISHTVKSCRNNQKMTWK